MKGITLLNPVLSVHNRTGAIPNLAIQKMVPANQSLGINVHFFRQGDGYPLVTDNDLNMIRLAGFRRVRMDLLWSDVEKQPGVFDFRKYDWAIQGLLRRGIRPMVILGLGNPLYANDLTIQPPWVQANFERYAEAVVKHYRGFGLTYELVNEPNHESFWKPKPNASEYMRLAIRLLPRLKSIDSTAFLVAPSTAGAPLDFLEACFQQGLLNMVDGVTIHPYQAFYKSFPANRTPESFEQKYQQTAALIKRYAPPGKRIPLLLGEWGYSSALGEVSESTQALYIVRQALLGIMYGAPVNIWYDWKGDIQGRSPNPGNKELNFEIVHSNLSPKPSYYAMQQLTREIGDKQYMGRLYTQPEDYILQFSSPKNTVYACWTADMPHLISINGRTLPLTAKPSYYPA